MIRWLAVALALCLEGGPPLSVDRALGGGQAAGFTVG